MKTLAQKEDDVSLFAKLRKKRALQSPGESFAAEWLKDNEDYFSKCDQSTSPGRLGSSAEDVKAVIVPLMIWAIGPVKNLYSGLAAEFRCSRHIPNTAVRVMGCGNSECNGLSLLMTTLGRANRERCPHCGKEQESVANSIEYSPRVGKQLHQMFTDHSICIHKFERAKLVENDSPQDALLLYDEAEAISREMGNDAVSSMIIIHKARALCFRLYQPSVAVQLAEEALDMARALKHVHRKEQLVAAITSVTEAIASLPTLESFESADDGFRS